MDEEIKILEFLSDQNFHSGEDLAERLGVSRAAVWKRIKHLKQLPGIELQSLSGKGYRLTSDIELLKQDAINCYISKESIDKIAGFEVIPQLPSTNDYLNKQGPVDIGWGRICIAEYQTQGKGRRGRQWISSVGRDVTMSVKWGFEKSLSSLGGLSLAVGVAVAEVMTELGVKGHALKWPNDILIEGKKVAGILVEGFGDMDGPGWATVGLGLNVSLSESEGQHIDQPWVAIDQFMVDKVQRNALVGKLITALFSAFVLFDREGLAGFLSRWENYDAFRGEKVRLLVGKDEVLGTYQGINENGGLILHDGHRDKVYYAGEVSLRSLS